MPRKPSKHCAFFFFLNDLLSFYGTGSKDDGAKKLSRDRDGLVYHSRTKAVLYRGACIEQPLCDGGYRWESTDEKSSSLRPGRISIDLEDTYQIGTITEFLETPVSWLCTPPIVSDLQVHWRRRRKKILCWIIELFLDFFFFWLIRIEARNSKALNSSVESVFKKKRKIFRKKNLYHILVD